MPCATQVWPGQLLARENELFFSRLLHVPHLSFKAARVGYVAKDSHVAQQRHLLIRGAEKQRIQAAEGLRGKLENKKDI